MQARGHAACGAHKAQPLQQLVGWQIDQAHLGRVLEHAIGHRFAHDDFRDLGDDVVQALDVLDVERAVHVDPGIEQLVDVLPSLRMTRPGRVGVRQFVHQDETGLAFERAIEIELVESHFAVVDLSSRKQLETDDERACIVPAVRLDDADHDVALQVAFGARRLQHRVRLADARRRPEEDDQLPASRASLFFRDAPQQLVGVRSTSHHGRGRHRGNARTALP